MQNHQMNLRVLWYCALCLLLVLLAGPAWANPPDMGPASEAGFAHGKVVYVDAAKGKDTPQCGREKTPCQTVNKGVMRARQIQDDPVAADSPDLSDVDAETANLVTVQLAAGTYNEAVRMNQDWLRLAGAGPGLTIISAGTTPGDDAWDTTALLVRGGHPVWVEGITFADSDTGMGARNGAHTFVTNCEFKNNVRGMDSGFSAQSLVRKTVFSGNRTGIWVPTGGTLIAEDIDITGQGQGTGVGVVAATGAVVQLWSADATLPNRIADTWIGVYGATNSTLEIDSMKVTHNTYGVYAEEDSFLRTYAGEISDSSIFGVYLDAYSHAIIDVGTVFWGNTGGDIVTDATSAYDVR